MNLRRRNFRWRSRSDRSAGRPARIVAISTSVSAILMLTSGAQAAGVEVLPAPPGSSGWSWPAAGHQNVLRSFDAPAQPWLSGHRGIDVSAAAGDQVLAPAVGTISFVGWVVNRPVITVTHRDGRRSSFESVESDLLVGTAVAHGDPIGTVAEPWHCGEFACLHWGVREGGLYVNPLQFVAGMRPSVLLPLSGRPPLR